MKAAWKQHLLDFGDLDVANGEDIFCRIMDTFAKIACFRFLKCQNILDSASAYCSTVSGCIPRERIFQVCKISQFVWNNGDVNQQECEGSPWVDYLTKLIHLGFSNGWTRT